MRPFGWCVVRSVGMQACQHQQNYIRHYIDLYTFMRRGKCVHSNCTFVSIIETHKAWLVFWWCACAHLGDVLYNVLVCRRANINGNILGITLICMLLGVGARMLIRIARLQNSLDTYGFITFVMVRMRPFKWHCVRRAGMRACQKQSKYKAFQWTPCFYVDDVLKWNTFGNLIFKQIRKQISTSFPGPEFFRNFQLSRLKRLRQANCQQAGWQFGPTITCTRLLSHSFIHFIVVDHTSLALFEHAEHVVATSCWWFNDAFVMFLQYTHIIWGFVDCFESFVIEEIVSPSISHIEIESS